MKEKKEKEKKNERKFGTRTHVFLLVSSSAIRRDNRHGFSKRGGEKKKKKISFIAVDNRLIEQIDFVSGSRVDRSIELSRRIINTFQTL